MLYKILLIDDDKALLEMLKKYFECKGYLVYIAHNGKEGLEKLIIEPDLILLDVNMPQMNGYEFCRRVRDKISCPILFLTAKMEEQDRINGLMLGGDDYIVKPFSLKELEARINAHLKREERRYFKSKVRFSDNLYIDYLKREVWYGDSKINFTAMEFEIIVFLSMHPGQVFDKERIYESVAGYEKEGNSKVITELIRRIRKKLEVNSEQAWIETVWGDGYRWKG